MTHSVSRDRWIVLATVFISMFIVFGVRLSYTVFYAEFTRQGWSGSVSASIFSFSMLTFAITSVPSGLFLDRYGPRLTFGIGALFLSVGLYLCSLANTSNEIALAYGLIAGIGITILGLAPQGGVVSLWFKENRGVAIGVAFAGTGIGALIFTPLVDRLIVWFGWRGAHAVLALICAVVLLPVILIGHKKPPVPPPHIEPESAAKIGRIIRQPSFWLLMLMSLGALWPLRSLTVHQVAYFETLGIERLHASAFVGFAGLLTAIAYVIWGRISDRLGRRATYALGSLCLAGAVLVMDVMGRSGNHTDLMLVLYSICYALAEGTRSSQPTAIGTDLFGSSRAGFTTGAIGAMFGLGAAIGPWLVGVLFDQGKSYEPGFITIIIAIIASVVAGFVINTKAKSNLGSKESHHEMQPLTWEG